MLALGVAARLTPVLELRPAGLRRLIRLSLPVAVVIVATLAASQWGGDWLKIKRELARPLPPKGLPNVLLIVLDTVAANHLSLHGYHRKTSPTLDELAAQGIRFDGVQASSSWTLLSDASMFTGLWPHESGRLVYTARRVPTDARRIPGITGLCDSRLHC